MSGRVPSNSAHESGHAWTPEEWLNPDAGDVKVWRYRGPLGTFSCSTAVKAVIVGLLGQVDRLRAESDALWSWGQRVCNDEPDAVAQLSRALDRYRGMGDRG